MQKEVHTIADIALTIALKSGVFWFVYNVLQHDKKQKLTYGQSILIVIGVRALIK